MKNKHLQASVLNSIFIFIYVGAVAAIMNNGNKIFGSVNGFLGATLFLLLFVLSATIVGSLILLKPITLYLENQKKEAIRQLIYTIVSLVIITIFVAIILIFNK